MLWFISKPMPVYLSYLTIIHANFTHLEDTWFLMKDVGRMSLSDIYAMQQDLAMMILVSRGKKNNMRKAMFTGVDKFMTVRRFLDRILQTFKEIPIPQASDQILELPPSFATLSYFVINYGQIEYRENFKSDVDLFNVKLLTSKVKKIMDGMIEAIDNGELKLSNATKCIVEKMLSSEVRFIILILRLIIFMLYVYLNIPYI
jgi:hypothetical protein